MENLKEIKDFSVLSTLSNFEGLGVYGGMYSTQLTQSLESIGKLKNLRYLALYNTRLIEKTFAPLLNLKKLVRFSSSWNCPDREFLKLKPLPKFKYGNTEKALQKYKKEIEKINQAVKRAKSKNL